MKKTIKETNSIGLVVDFLWGFVVLGGCSYLVFFRGANPWWFLLTVILLSASFSIKTTTYEED